MARALIWIDDTKNLGWACSSCSWKYPVPTLLSDAEARAAYDRLADAKFRSHVCTSKSPEPLQAPNTSTEPPFTDRIRRLVKMGYKPKDAVELALSELALEHWADRDRMSRARAEGEEFLRKVRAGLI